MTKWTILERPAPVRLRSVERFRYKAIARGEAPVTGLGALVTPGADPLGVGFKQFLHLGAGVEVSEQATHRFASAVADLGPVGEGCDVVLQLTEAMRGALGHGEVRAQKCR